MATQSVRIGWRPYVNLATATYLLDTYTGASAAFSLRKLISTYTGSAVRVRRSGDNVERNIPFNSNGDLDTNTLLDFVGYTNLFTSPNNLADTGWGVNGLTKTANLTNDFPTGATSSNKLTETATNVQHFISYSIISGTIDTHNVSAYLKKGTGSAAPDRISISVGNVTYGMYAIFNLSTGVIETQVQGTATSFQVAMTSVGNGWYRCSVGGKLNYTTNQSIRTSVQFCNNSTSYNPFTTSYLGNVNADVLVANLQWLREVGLQRYGTSGNGSGFVTTWYDQISTNNLVQITAANQPQIVNNGVLITSNGKPSVLYDGTNDQFNAAAIVIGSDVTSTNTGGKPSTVFSVFDLNSAYSGTNEYPIFGGTSHYASRFSINANKYYFINDTVIGSGLSSNMTATTGTKLGTVLFSGTNDKLRINGIESISGSVGNLGNGGNFIGRSWLGKFFYGKISEVVIYSVNDKSANFTDIESNINTYYSIYTPIITNGLVLNLDASSTNPGTGSTWSDMSASGYNGTLVNGPIFATANDGVINFDGINDYVSFSSQVLNSSSFTIDMFVNSNNLNISGSRWRRLLVIDGNGLTENPFSIFIDSSGRLGYILGNGTTNFDTQVPLPNSPILSTNNWYNIVISFDGSSKRVYVNGVLYSTINNSSTFTNTLNKNMIIGYFGDTSAGYFSGKISSTRIYNRALTATEITQNFNTTKSRFGL